MSKQRYGEKNKNTIFRWLYFILFGLISVWLLTSIITKESPANMLRNIFSKMPGSGPASCEELILQKDSIIKSLELQLSDKRGNSVSSRGIVIIESQSLNMRNRPSLSSNILVKIPANSEVEIMYYDSKTYYLDGEPGKWCKIRYAESEGWVWGNYVKEI